MQGFSLIFKKEIKNMLSRRNLLSRLLIFIVLNMLLILSFNYIKVQISLPIEYFAFAAMLFTCFAFLGFLAVDAVGSEKQGRMLETLITLPISVFGILMGKIVFMLLVGAVFISSVTLLDCVLMSAVFGTSLLNLNESFPYVILIYSVTLVSIFVVVIFSTVISIAVNNPRISRYVTLLFSIAMLYLIVQVAMSGEFKNLMELGAFMAIAGFIFVILSNKLFTKQFLMNYIKN